MMFVRRHVHISSTVLYVHTVVLYCTLYCWCTIQQQCVVHWYFDVWYWYHHHLHLLFSSCAPPSAEWLGDCWREKKDERDREWPFHNLPAGRRCCCRCHVSLFRRHKIFLLLSCKRGYNNKYTTKQGMCGAKNCCCVGVVAREERRRACWWKPAAFNVQSVQQYSVYVHHGVAA